MKMVRSYQNMQWVWLSERIFHTYVSVQLNTYQYTETHLTKHYNVLFVSHGELPLWFSAPVILGHHNFYYMYFIASSWDVSFSTLLSTVRDAEQCCGTHKLQKTRSTGVTPLWSRYVHPSWQKRTGSVDGWPVWQQGKERMHRWEAINLLKPTGYVMYQQFNIQQLYVLPTLYLCVLCLSENKQRLVPLTS
jgi:hypothetical protein